MKALQKFVQLSLILVITLTTMGFRVSIEECHGHKEKQISFFGAPDCCCDKAENNSKPKKDACQDLTCIVQGNLQSQISFNGATEQASKELKTPLAYQAFTQIIRPVLLEKIPHFTLPPPHSGRTIGILHQTFII